MAHAGEAILTGVRSNPTAGAVVEVRDLVKVYGGDRGHPGVPVVDGVTFDVAAGEFFGFLGPNGAGKTTTIKVLATLTRSTAGEARVLGLDVATDAAAVRARIGLAMQSPAVEGLLTGRQNLRLNGRLRRVPERELPARVHELLVPGGHWLLACWATDPATGWFSHVVNGALAEWGVAPSTLRRLVQGRFHLLDAILLTDAEPLPLAHYLLKKGDGPPGEWPADPPHDGSFADEHGRWRFEPGYPYPILERYLR